MLDQLKLKAYILVDSDPHGVEIMMTYKFGSLALSHISDELACPSIIWIGLKPTDAESLKATSQPLSPEELKKVADIQKSRPYISPQLQKQFNTFKRIKRKTEIEALHEFSPTYLVREFIPNMIKISEIDTDDE